MSIPTSQSHIQWRATEWILAFGPLNPSIVMDYFVLSPFYDRASTNAQWRMQMMFSGGGVGIEEVELRRFVGVEYVVVESQAPALFVIHKRDRTSPTEAKTIAVYYVLNDNVYQAPTLYSVINERVLTSVQALSTSLNLLKAKKPTWTAERLYAWDIKPPPIGQSAPIDAIPHAEEVVVEGETPSSRKRSHSEGGGLDEETERPATMFNPLLFRALQTVASSLPLLPGMDLPPPPPVVEPKPVAPEVKEGTPRAESKSDVNGSGIRIGPTGKRKPKGAA